MSVAEIATELTKLSSKEREEVREILAAIEEGISVEELRQIDAALIEGEKDIEDVDCLTIDQVKSSLGLS